MTVKANHRASRRSRIQKCCWVAGTLGTAVSAWSKGDWDQSLSNLTPPMDSNGSQAFYYPESETTDLHPATAIRLLDNLFLSGSLDATAPNFASTPYYSSYPLNGNDGFEGPMSAFGNEWTWGNIGLTWQPTEHQHLFLNYSSLVDAGSGQLTADSIQPWAEGSGISPAIEFPAIIGLGYGFQLTDTISLEADVQWLDFSADRSFDLSAANAPVLLTMGAQAVGAPENPRNLFASGVGGDWKFADHWALRARYDFFENPGHNSNSAFSPTTPDVNQHVITLGVAWKGKKSSLELAYAMDFYYDLHIANDRQPSFNSVYGFSEHMLSLAYKFTF